MYSQFIQVLLYLLISLNIVLGHPIKQHGENKVEFKDEKKYPNGTVIGKYSYKDKEGNPIHVKYFADDSSYGVELKSVKVFGSHLLKEKPKFELMAEDPLGALNSINTANSIIDKEFNFNQSYNPFEVLKSFPKENNYKGNKKQDDDYDIFLENDLKPSGNCGKGKIRVYSDKTRRKIRELTNDNKLYCERY